MVICDHMGEFYASLSKMGIKAASTEVTEMVAAFEVIKFGLEVDFRDVIHEGNNISVINDVCSNEESLISCD